MTASFEGPKRAKHINQWQTTRLTTREIVVSLHGLSDKKQLRRGKSIMANDVGNSRIRCSCCIYAVLSCSCTNSISLWTKIQLQRALKKSSHIQTGTTSIGPHVKLAVRSKQCESIAIVISCWASIGSCQGKGRVKNAEFSKRCRACANTTRLFVRKRSPGQAKHNKTTSSWPFGADF